MKKITFILSVITLCIVLVSCGQEKVAHDELTFDKQTAIVNGEPFTGIAVIERRRGRLNHQYYEDGILVKEVTGFSEGGTWEMGKIEYETDKITGETIDYQSYE